MTGEGDVITLDIKGNNLIKVVLSLGAVVCFSAPAHADWAQTFGIGQKSSNLGSAVTATADDYDVFFTNPAGAANFDGTFIGFGVKTHDTRGLKAVTSDAQSLGPIPTGAGSILRTLGLNSMADIFTPPQNGVDMGPDRTLPNGDIGFAPAGGGYAPVPGMEYVVVGVGFGAPFLMSAKFGGANAPGNYVKFNTTGAGLIVAETAPTVAVRVNDKLNVGASLNVTTMKYFQFSHALGAQALGTGTMGSVNLQTDNTIHIPGVEPSFSMSPTDVTYTLGAQYKVTPQLAVGVTYRAKTAETFEGEANTTVNCIGVGSACLIGPYHLRDHFKIEAELPAHLQAGLAYAVTPAWKVMADVRWTNWSDTKGFGSPLVIQMTDGTMNIGKAIADDLRPFPSPIPSAPIRTITVNYGAQDTYSLHFGTSYKLTSNLELQAGYVYDPSAMPDYSIDLNTLSSNRHIFSLGGSYTVPTEDGLWTLTAGGQFISYEDRHIAANASRNLGGLDGLDTLLTGNEHPQFTRNSLGGMDIGGYVWSVGASISYKFGNKSAQLDDSEILK